MVCSVTEDSFSRKRGQCLQRLLPRVDGSHPCLGVLIVHLGHQVNNVVAVVRNQGGGSSSQFLQRQLLGTAQAAHQSDLGLPPRCQQRQPCDTLPILPRSHPLPSGGCPRIVQLRASVPKPLSSPSSTSSISVNLIKPLLQVTSRIGRGQLSGYSSLLLAIGSGRGMKGTTGISSSRLQTRMPRQRSTQPSEPPPIAITLSALWRSWTRRRGGHTAKPLV